MSTKGSIPRRDYGQTGVRLSVIALGGVVVAQTEQNRANRIVAEAVERGINYFDVAPTYWDAEIVLGPALQPYRKDVFLACKTAFRDRAAAEEDFNRSLERLRTDYFDLYQLHGLQRVKEDVDAAFAKDGVMPMLIDRLKAGQIRYLGFSAHTEEAALAAMDRFDFASALFPVNFACFHNTGFGPRIMEAAIEKGVARLALKAMAKGRWSKGDPRIEQYPKCWYDPIGDPETAALALRWTLSQPVTAAVPPGDERLFRIAMDTAEGPLDLSPEEEDRLMQTAGAAPALFPQP